MGGDDGGVGGDGRGVGGDNRGGWRWVGRVETTGVVDDVYDREAEAWRGNWRTGTRTTSRRRRTSCRNYLPLTGSHRRP